MTVSNAKKVKPTKKLNDKHNLTLKYEYPHTQTSNHTLPN